MIALVVALAAIALLVARPARVVGVGEGPLADSLRAEVEANRTACAQIEGGRPTGSVWRCNAGRGTSYSVQASDWGCWNAERIDGRGPRRADACIWAGDFVPVID